MPVLQLVEFVQLLLQLLAPLLHLLRLALAVAQLLAQLGELLLQLGERFLVLVPGPLQRLQAFAVGVVARLQRHRLLRDLL